LPPRRKQDWTSRRALFTHRGVVSIYGAQILHVGHPHKKFEFEKAAKHHQGTARQGVYVRVSCSAVKRLRLRAGMRKSSLN